jgi:hypothetical protein
MHVRYYLQDVLYLYVFYKVIHLLKMSHCLVMCMMMVLNNKLKELPHFRRLNSLDNNRKH